MSYNSEKELENDLKDIASKHNVKLYSYDVQQLMPSESIRLKCQVPLCEYYAVCKVCPPNIPSVEEFRKVLKDYTQCFLVVFQEDIENIEHYRHDFRAELKLAEAVSELEKTAFVHGNYMAFGLTVGGCKWCADCTLPGEPCRHPFQARPSPEGFGIDITRLAREVGVSVEWPPRKTINFIGLLLL